MLNYFEEGYLSVLSITVPFDVGLHHSMLQTCCLSDESYVILSVFHQNHLQMKDELFAISCSSLTKVTILFLICQICFCLACSFLTKEGLAVCILAVLVSLGKHDVDESENVI